MRLILLGAPGSGKGTQGEALAKRYGVPHISSGELLRAHVQRGTELGTRAADYLARGDLVPDDLALAIVGEAVIGAVNSGGGYVLEGFPRTLAQAERAYELAAPIGAEADAVVLLAVSDEVARQRLAGRASFGRNDDADMAVIERRLRVFNDEAEPVIDFYRRRNLLVTVDASAPPEAVTEAITAAVSGLR